MFWAIGLLAVAATGAVVWFYMRIFAENAVLKAENARLKDQDAQLRAQFQALSADALARNNQQFLDLAKTELSRHQSEAEAALDALVKPIQESLTRVDAQIHAVELARVGAYSALTDQVRAMSEEARKLAGALRSPNARGRWGEIQLKRVVELAGMTAYCDFEEQASVATDEGRLRPDLIVRLPNDRQMVVDSKVPLSAYLDSLDAADEATAAERLKQHAQQVRKHVERLGQKAYWSQFRQAPDFVIAFLPGEIFFSAALQLQPDLIEYGVRNNVVLATPTTLIALLRAVACGWRENLLAKNAEEIRALGAELYDRVRIFAEHYSEVGAALSKAVTAYTRGRGSLDARLLATARKLEELGIDRRRELGEVTAIEAGPLFDTVYTGQR
jgi:DNA recombination protein RmuC